LLSIPEFRHYITKKRWGIFLKTGASLDIYNGRDAEVFEETVAHNIEGIKHSVASIQSLERSELVFRPVMAIDTVYSYALRSVFPEITVLLIGSRTE
jgi:hypothetical protein